MARRIGRLLVALLLVSTPGLHAVLAPALACADGDPASDFLLAQNVFYPFSPPVARSLQGALDAETAATQRAGLPLKVALIHSPLDLGAVPVLFGKPQTYARFLDSEISFNGVRPLLVVMPNGYGVWGLSAPVAHVLRTLRPPLGGSNDDLAHAALTAVATLAAADGHPIRVSAGTGAGGRADRAANGTPALLVAAALAVAAVIAAGCVLFLRRRRRYSGKPASARGR